MTPFNSHLIFFPAHVSVSGALQVLMRITPSPTTAFGCLCLNNIPTKRQRQQLVADCRQRSCKSRQPAPHPAKNCGLQRTRSSRYSASWQFPTQCIPPQKPLTAPCPCQPGRAEPGRDLPGGSTPAIFCSGSQVPR